MGSFREEWWGFRCDEGGCGKELRYPGEQPQALVFASALAREGWLLDVDVEFSAGPLSQPDPRVYCVDHALARRLERAMLAVEPIRELDVARSGDRMADRPPRAGEQWSGRHIRQFLAEESRGEVGDDRIYRVVSSSPNGRLCLRDIGRL